MKVVKIEKTIVISLDENEYDFAMYCYDIQYSDISFILQRSYLQAISDNKNIGSSISGFNNKLLKLLDDNKANQVKILPINNSKIN